MDGKCDKCGQQTEQLLARAPGPQRWCPLCIVTNGYHRAGRVPVLQTPEAEDVHRRERGRWCKSYDVAIGRLLGPHIKNESDILAASALAKTAARIALEAYQDRWPTPDEEEED